MMPHLRKRFIEKHLSKAVSWAPCVSLSGMRQTGKTTLIKHFSKSYFTFDDPALSGRLQRESQAFLKGGPFPLGLDEVQTYPPLFPLLKRVIDEKRVPGRYLITGSIRFAQKKEIRESLTGRTASFELYPLSIAECHNRLPKDLVGELKKKSSVKFLKELEKNSWATFRDLENFVQKGGLPGICFKRESSVVRQLFDQHLDTILGRDFKLLHETETSLQNLRHLLARIVERQGLPMNYSDLAKEIGLSAPTVKKLLTTMEALYLVRTLGKTYYCEDIGIANFLAGSLERSRKRVLLGFLYHELRCQLSCWHPSGFEMSSFETRGGANVPFTIRMSSGETMGCTLDEAERVSEKSLKSLSAFKKKQRKAFLLALHLGEQAFTASNGALCAPLKWIL